MVVRTGVDGLLADALALVGGQLTAVGVAVTVAGVDAVAVTVAVGVPVEVAEADPAELEVSSALAAAAALPTLLEVGPAPVEEAEAEGGIGATQVPLMAVPEAAEAGRDSTVPYTSEPSPSEKATAAAARRLRRKTDTPAEETSVDASSIEVF